MKRTSLVVALIAVVCIAGAMVEWSNRVAISTSAAEFDSYDTRDGKKEAEADLAQGHAKWKVYGLYRRMDEDSARMKRLGVHVDWFAGCIVSDGILLYAYRYNLAVHSHYVALVGKEITEEVLGPTPVDPLSEREEKEG